MKDKISAKYNGVVVPMVSPFTSSGKIDERAVIKIINNFFRNGVNPFILGTDGEANSIDDYEKLRFAKIVSNNFREKLTLYAGIGSNNFNTSVDYAKRYYDLGFEVMVAHLPSYYRLNESQVLNYFEKLVEAVPGNLMLYNVNESSHISIPVSAIGKLSYHPRIVGIIDNEKDIFRLNTMIEMIKDRDDFSHFTGWGKQSANGLLRGSNGIVPGTANLIPGKYKLMYDAAAAGDKRTALRIQEETDKITEIYSKGRMMGESLAALKLMMKTANLCDINVLPPLTKLSESEKQKIFNQLDSVKSGTGLYQPEVAFL